MVLHCRDFYSEVQHEIDSVYSEIAKTARFKLPQFNVIDDAKRTQRALTTGRLPQLKPLPGHILDKVKNMSSQESAKLIAFLCPIALPSSDQGCGHQRYSDQYH